jgi:hypothetical protein
MGALQGAPDHYSQKAQCLGVFHHRWQTLRCTGIAQVA